MEEVPAQWVHLHGKIVWRAAVVQDKRKTLSAYGLRRDWQLSSLLGLKRADQVAGDFSFVKVMP
jgi:hypothetical protein